MASASSTSYNKKSSAVKRILSEARELEADGSREYCAAPLEDNIFEWHFTLRGAPGSEFEAGIYHGRILLPPEYPFRPPSLMLLTPNGRWECGKKICLTFTGFHEEQWQPAWGIRTALLGVQAFMTARREAAQGVGALDVSQTERERMARSSVGWTCAACARRNDEILPPAPLGERRGAEQLPHGLEVADASTPAEGPTPVSQATDKALAQAAAPEAALLATPQPTVEEPPAANLAALAASGASAASAEAKAPPTEQVPPRVPVAPAPSASTEAATSAPLGVADAATSRASGSSAPRERSTPSWLPAHAPPPPPPSSAASRAPAAQPAIRLPHAAATLRPQRPALGPRVSTGTLRPAAAAAATHAAQAAARPAAEQRVAQLDRAIATVVLLLACMLVRRWLQ